MWETGTFPKKPVVEESDEDKEKRKEREAAVEANNKLNEFERKSMETQKQSIAKVDVPVSKDTVLVSRKKKSYTITFWMTFTRPTFRVIGNSRSAFFGSFTSFS